MSETIIIRLSPRRAAALERVIDMQLACEEAGMFPPQPTAEERDLEMFPEPRHPVQDGNAVRYPIACRRNELARRCGEPLGGCAWVADDTNPIPGSVACKTCGKMVSPPMPRAKALRSMVDGIYLPSEHGRRETMATLGLVQDEQPDEDPNVVGPFRGSRER